MQKGAQYQAVWELISEIFKDKIPADSISMLMSESVNISARKTAVLLPRRFGKLSATAANWYLMPVQTRRGGFC